MQDYVISSGGDYALRVTASDPKDACLQAAALLTSPGPHRLHTEEEWRELCRRNHSDSADSDMVRIACAARRREAVQQGLPLA